MKKFFLNNAAIFLIIIFSLAPAVSAEKKSESLSDEQLLDIIQRQSLEYFLQESNPNTGLVRDKAHNFKPGQTVAPASIAAVGFALTAYGIAVERHWMDVGTARERTRRTLQFFLDQAAQEHGFFYHFLDVNSGKRAMRSELSPIDTALFLAGVLFAAEYYEDPEIRDLADKIYQRVDWSWMLHGGKTLSMAWSPESGFSRSYWDHYNESLMMYLLAIGSPSHPIPPSSWKQMKRPVGSYGKYRLIQMPPLFTHQYSHLWIDFRNKNDGFADYFQNSINATLANRQFCIDESKKFLSYGPNSWGLTASDGPGGYKAYGAPPGWATQDGTVAPTACGGSIAFTPKESLACLRHFYEDLHESLWGRYGFSDAFNLDKNWFSKDVYGIDQGAILLMIENYRSELIWKTMKKNVFLQEAMKAVGFKEGSMELPWPDPPESKAYYAAGMIEVDGYLKDWPNRPVLTLSKENATVGRVKNDFDLEADFQFAWDENALYFYARVSDESVLARRVARALWQDDLVEIFVDPENDGLTWKSEKDFQIGFRPNPKDNSVAMWSWFQDEDPSAKGLVKAAGYVHKSGYVIEGSISWDYLGIRPKAGMTLRLSPAVHDVDKDRTESKAEWFMRNEEKWLRFALGRIILGPETEVPSKKL